MFQRDDKPPRHVVYVYACPRAAAHFDRRGDAQLPAGQLRPRARGRDHRTPRRARLGADRCRGAAGRVVIGLVSLRSGLILGSALD